MKENQPEQKFRAYQWDTGQPIDVICGESERRMFQKHMMANDGLKGSGRWLEFRPLEPAEQVINVLKGIGLDAVLLGDEEI